MPNNISTTENVGHTARFNVVAFSKPAIECWIQVILEIECRYLQSTYYIFNLAYTFSFYRFNSS